MTLQLRKAERKKAKLRVGLGGPSGSGKTYSALLLASGLTQWEKIAIIDTENGSGELYSDLGPYNVLTLTDNFAPERYIEAIHECEKAGMEVIIIDSITHEWDGKGGCLEIVEQLGGKYQDWNKVTPRHKRFIDAILQSKCHIITTVRKKQDYEMTKDQNGKVKVEKVGMKEITREGFEYELTLSFELDLRHNAKASKDRTGIYMDAPEVVIDETVGNKLLEWANSGKVDQGKEPLTKEQWAKIEELIIQLGAERPEVEKWIIQTYKMSTSGLTQGQADDLIAKFTAKVAKKEEEKKAAEQQAKEEDKTEEMLGQIEQIENGEQITYEEETNELDKALNGPEPETDNKKRMKAAAAKAHEGEIIH